ncbi:hypothetical protein QYE76_037440 [Lolium multiflorum]|uniref:CCHC-type domain-containing protein n=1 Tax=Lolium multiflorum TaxID=4521 RepID=A0AAD8QGN7_LOLMU|nr:hypothetical protein QYE76_037440 [Lolium multiflorum]
MARIGRVGTSRHVKKRAWAPPGSSTHRFPHLLPTPEPTPTPLDRHRRRRRRAPACNRHSCLSRNHHPSTRPPPPRPAAAVSPGTELAATATQPPRPQGVRPFAAMDSDDEMMVQLFTEEQNSEAVRRQQQQLILTSMLRVRQPLFLVPRRDGSKPGKRRNINRHHQAGAMLLDADYFNDDATHSPKEFRRRFRMNMALFLKIVYGVREYDNYFMAKQDCTEAPADDAPDDVKNVYAMKVDDSTTVQCLMLTCMDPELQKRFENTSAHDMIAQLGIIPISKKKNTNELFPMLKTAEASMQKDTNHVMMVNKTTSFKKKRKAKKGKDAGKTGTQEKPKGGASKETECFYCKGSGHWKRNCKKYLVDKKSGASGKGTAEGEKTGKE